MTGSSGAPVLYVTHPAFGKHQTGSLHPERVARLRAVEQGVVDSGVSIRRLEPPPAGREMLERVHTPIYLDAIERFCRGGGGHLDPDTVAGPDSWEAAIRAAGAGSAAAGAIAASGEIRFGFLALRPPGHHATPDRAMGFCLLNNVAVTAASLVAEGATVAIVDWDVHHGNGTQEIFYTDPRVLYISIHQYPFYPYQGRLDEVGEGPGRGLTINIPLPAGTAGDAYLMAWNEVVEPILSQFGADWVLVSAGYDAHAEDPLAELRLEANDYGWMAARLARLHANKPVLAFLEGGYHLPALTSSVSATLRGLIGETPSWAAEFRSPDEAFRIVEMLKVTAREYWPL
ncbi:MAG: histone deacetylase family protein [Acidimicrobiia bacterium]